MIPASIEVTFTSANAKRNPGITFNRSDTTQRISQVLFPCGSEMPRSFAIISSDMAPKTTRPNATPAGVKNSRPNLMKIKEQPQTIPSNTKSKSQDFCFNLLPFKVIS